MSIKSKSLFQKLSEQHILIVGDVMLDRYLNGSVDRISPEAPVPVVHLQSEEVRLGGAANVALNIKAMGATPYLCSVIGNDFYGEQFKQLLPKMNLSTEGLCSVTERPTTVKSRVLSGFQQLLRIDREITTPLDIEHENQLLSKICTILENYPISAILFQDYNKGVLTKSLIRKIILEAIKRDIPTAVDPKFNNFWAYKRVNLFKPNLREVRAFVSVPDTSLDALETASQTINKQLDNQYTLITLSEKGVFISNQQNNRLIPTTPRKIADVCGAGDTVISLATLGLAARLDMFAIAQLANLAGGQVCEKVGVVAVNRAQLEREYTSS